MGMSVFAVIKRSVSLDRTLPFRFTPGKRYAEDHLLWLQIACTGEPLYVMDAVLVAKHKLLGGGDGLSDRLLAMQGGALDILWRLKKSGAISWPMAAAAATWSNIRFLRRLAILPLRLL